MQQFIETLQQYPFFISFILGLIPALIWLWFWLKEDSHPEPAKMITLSFLGGMVAVILVLPLQQIIYDNIKNDSYMPFLLWASLEELFKLIIIYFIALSRRVTDEPMDTIIYMIIGALGFVALENTFFLVDQIHAGDLLGVIITGNMRFVGASLLHIISSATIGIFMAISFYKSQIQKNIYLVCGIILAIALHTLFNISIMKSSDGNIFLTFGFVWIGIIGLLLAIEKIKHLVITK